MKEFTPYNINEIIALVTAVLIGTGAYIGFMVLKKQKKVSFAFIFWVLLINLFVTYLFSELLKVMNWGAYRTLVLPLVAYAGQYFMEYFDKKYLKIFDAGLKKAGLDVNNTEENTTTENYETEENINNGEGVNN